MSLIRIAPFDSLSPESSPVRVAHLRHGFPARSVREHDIWHSESGISETGFRSTDSGRKKQLRTGEESACEFATARQEGEC